MLIIKIIYIINSYVRFYMENRMMRRIFPLVSLLIILFFGGLSVYFANAPVSHKDLLVYDGKTLSIIGVDGSKKQALNQSKVALAYWSPDGEKIAYLVDAGLYLTPREQIRPARLTSQLNAKNVSGMQWTPDGRQIVLSDSEGKLHFMDIATGRAKTVIGTTGIYYPAISPDGTQIAYGTTRNGLNSSIFVSDINGKNARPLVSNFPDTANHSPKWSPDGQVISFVAGTKLGLFEVNTRKITYQTTGRRLMSSVMWSPDNKKMAFVYEDAKSRLLLWGIADASGKILQPLADGTYIRGWSPDSTEVLITKSSGTTAKMLALMNVTTNKQSNLVLGDWGSFSTPALTNGLDLRAGVKQAWALVGPYCAGALGIVLFLWMLSASITSYRRMSPDQRRTAAILGGAAVLGTLSALSAASAASAKRQQEERERAERTARDNAQMNRQKAAAQPSRTQPPAEDEYERAERLEALRAQQQAQYEEQRRDEERRERERWQAEERRNEDIRRWSEMKNQEARDRGESTTY